MRKLLARVRTRRPGGLSPDTASIDVSEPTRSKPADPATFNATNSSKEAGADHDTRAESDRETSPSAGTISGAKTSPALIHQSGQKRSGTALQTVKWLLESAEAGLAGVGIPGVEAIAKVPLLVLRYYEVL